MILPWAREARVLRTGWGRGLDPRHHHAGRRRDPAKACRVCMKRLWESPSGGTPPALR